MSYTLLEEILATTTQRPPYAALHTWLLATQQLNRIILAISCLMPTVLPWHPGSPEATTFLLNECNEKNCWIHGMQAVWWQEVSPWSKIYKVDIGAVKKSRWTHRKANENQWLWQFAYLWSRNWPHSRLPTLQLQVDKIPVASFFFCFLLSPLRWESRSSTALILKRVALCDLATLRSLDVVLSKQTPWKSPT